MYLTEQEILDTPESLKKTIAYVKQRERELKLFFRTHKERRFVFFGCGSGFMLAKSAAALFGTFPDTAATAIPAGDYLVAPKDWTETVKGSIIVALSRSGLTSELVRTIRQIKETFDCTILSVCTHPDNALTPLSTLALSLEWCCDRSVCQTRTVINLYAAMLMLAAVYSGDEVLMSAVQDAAEQNAVLQAETAPLLQRLARDGWKDAVVLADGVVCGAAEEAALAFTEISILTGRYFHLLDYRHGPVVISGANTLTLILLRPGETKLQKDLVRDIVGRGGPVITVSVEDAPLTGETAHVRLGEIRHFAAQAIPFLTVAQTLALRKAEALGTNPDAPRGLDAYIELK